jgi:hypothetical protein
MSTTTLSPAEQQLLKEMERAGVVDAPVAPIVPAAPAPESAPAVLENDPTGVTPAKSAPTPDSKVLPELRYEYQPKDPATGRPVGGKQVIKYRTEQELREKLVEQNTLILLQLRKVTREKELGTAEPEVDDAEKFENVVEFKPRDLSADERFTLSQKLQNPETAADARDLLIESAFGVKPSVLAQTLNDQQKFMIQQRAVENFLQFVNSGVGYYDTPANREAITTWMVRKNYAPTITNFNRAYQHLAAQVGLLETAPEVHQEIVPPAPAPVVAPAVVPVEQAPKPQEPVVTNPGLGSEPQQQAKRHSHVPSALNPSVASTAGDSPVTGNAVTLADIDRLPADVYKAKMKDPAFRKLVDQLEDDAAKKRRAKQLGQV